MWVFALISKRPNSIHREQPFRLDFKKLHALNLSWYTRDMGKRISEEKRRKIQNAKGSIRQIAAAPEIDVSPTTVQLWRRRDHINENVRLKKLDISESEVAMFREAVRITRYRLKSLIEYLAPAWGRLPSESALNALEHEEEFEITGGCFLDPLTGKAYNDLISQKDLRLAMKRISLSKCYDSSKGSELAVAVHRIKVWWECNDKKISGELLIFLHRRTGLVYGRVYTDRLTHEMLNNSLFKIERMLNYKVSYIDFVTSKGEKGYCTTALNLEITPPQREKNPPKTNEAVLHAAPFSRSDILARADHLTPHQEKRIKIPGRYKNKKELNKRIEKAINLINKDSALHSRSNVRFTTSPLSNLLKAEMKFNKDKSAKGRKNLLAKIEKRISLPLR